MQDYRAEMGFTSDELLKGIPAAVHPYAITKSSDFVYLFQQDERIARMEISPERSRTMAAMTLPVTDLVISFQNFNTTQKQAFIARFKKYLHRGGG